VNDPNSGLAGYPTLQADNFSVTNPLVNPGDVSTPTSGLGQSYLRSLPILSILGTNNPNGEPRLDKIGLRRYVTASVVKTEELLLWLPSQ
jgi:hypothetical protein